MPINERDVRDIRMRSRIFLSQRMSVTRKITICASILLCILRQAFSTGSYKNPVTRCLFVDETFLFLQSMFQPYLCTVIESASVFFWWFVAYIFYIMAFFLGICIYKMFQHFFCYFFVIYSWIIFIRFFSKRCDSLPSILCINIIKLYINIFTNYMSRPIPKPASCVKFNFLQNEKNVYFRLCTILYDVNTLK